MTQRELFWAQRDHLPALDGLRAIAALLVVVFHSTLWFGLMLGEPATVLPTALQRVLLNCWSGVDIFFVLSGFLIGRILFGQLLQGPISFRAFYLRRTLRIFPAYYVVLTLSVFFFARHAAFRALYQAAPWETILRRSWANYLYLGNYLYGAVVPNAMTWAWSLCVEEHFYLLLPALLAVLFRWTSERGRVAILGTLALLPLVMRAAAHMEDARANVFVSIYPESHTHFEGLLLGVLIAYGYVYRRTDFDRVVSRLRALPWIAGLGCIGAVLWWGGLLRRGVFPVIFQFFVIACGASLLVINGLFRDNRTSRFLAHPVWRPLARLSYGVYLVHLFVVVWVITWWPAGHHGASSWVMSLFAFMAAVLLASLLAAALLFFSIERPMLDLGARLSRQYLLGGAAAGSRNELLGQQPASSSGGNHQP